MSGNENKVNELNEALKGMWDSLTDEQKERAKECKSMDELMSLAGKMRIELPDELLETVAGGIRWCFDAKETFNTVYCPYCRKSNYQTVYPGGANSVSVRCRKCDGKYIQADDGSTYDENGNFLGTFKSGCH